MYKSVGFRRLLSALIILILGVHMLGAAAVKDFDFNPAEHPVYLYIKAETLLNAQNAKEKYNNKYLVVLGEYYKDYDSKKKTFSMNIGKIKCSFDKNVNVEGDFKNYTLRKEIEVFGLCKTDGKKLIKLENVQKVREPKIDINNIKGECFCTLDDKSFAKDGNSVIQREVKRKNKNNQPSLTYYIPKKYVDLEARTDREEKNEKVGYLDGYQYAFNKDPDDPSLKPESLFIGYFSKDELKRRSDIDNKEIDIMKAMIETMEGKSIGKLFTFTFTDITYTNGNNTKKYKCYLGNHYDTVSKETYRVEYIFRINEGDGITVMIYFHHPKETKHLSEVMFIAETMELN